MKVLVVGSGGREHALIWKIAQSPRVTKVYCAPGNAGISQIAECVPIPANDILALLRFAKEQQIDLTVVGPEDPLAEGIADFFRAEGLLVFGPSKDAARLESSKAFAKRLMDKYRIPTAAYEVFVSPEDAINYVRRIGAPVVIKADGLAAGKGVTVARTVEEAVQAIEAAMMKRVFGIAGERIVIEEYLQGEEASILAFTDGETVLPMAASQDHKPVYDNDQGPNTGGMGAYSPAPLVNMDLFNTVLDKILKPCVSGMREEGHPYCGCLYAGIMITDEGPKVVEFNCRFGDPETQVVLPRMASDLVEPLLACCQGNLDGVSITWRQEACVTVVMASGGYPGSYEKNKIIRGIEEAEKNSDTIVFHAGTRLSEKGEFLTNGGRVLNVTALGTTVPEAIERAYAAVAKIHFEKAHFRKDIGQKALKYL